MLNLLINIFSLILCVRLRIFHAYSKCSWLNDTDILIIASTTPPTLRFGSSHLAYQACITVTIMASHRPYFRPSLNYLSNFPATPLNTCIDTYWTSKSWFWFSLPIFSVYFADWLYWRSIDYFITYDSWIQIMLMYYFKALHIYWMMPLIFHYRLR